MEEKTWPKYVEWINMAQNMARSNLRFPQKGEFIKNGVIRSNTKWCNTQ